MNIGAPRYSTSMRRARGSGFTLVEVVVAVSILAFVVVSASAMAIQLLTIMTANRSRAAAVATADSSLTAFVANGNYSTAPAGETSLAGDQSKLEQVRACYNGGSAACDVDYATRMTVPAIANTSPTGTLPAGANDVVTTRTVNGVELRITRVTGPCSIKAINGIWSCSVTTNPGVTTRRFTVLVQWRDASNKYTPDTTIVRSRLVD